MKPINETLYAIPLISGCYYNIGITIQNKVIADTNDSSNWHTMSVQLPFDDDFKILGTITRTECDFDLTNIVSHCPIEGRFLKFQSLIESTTGYLFDNPLNDSFHLKAHIINGTWQEHQDRVVEKLVIIEKK